MSRPKARSRATISSSASAGMPGTPSLADHSPSCMQPPPARRSISQCCASTIGRPTRADTPTLYSMARRMSRSSCTPAPSSVKIVTWLSGSAASSPIGASCSPPRPTVMAAAGVTSIRPKRLARSRTQLATSTESMAGSVLGMATTWPYPPSAAAREPDSIVSASSRPGSRRWACRSTRAGATTHPPASIRAPGRARRFRSRRRRSGCPRSARRPDVCRRGRRRRRRGSAASVHPRQPRSSPPVASSTRSRREPRRRNNTAMRTGTPLRT